MILIIVFIILTICLHTDESNHEWQNKLYFDIHVHVTVFGVCCHVKIFIQKS